MSDLRRIGVFGGTFDPVHLGHLDAAAAARAVGLDEIRMLPSRRPPHRPQQPHASIYHRFAMAALALRCREGMTISDLELRSPGHSYTSKTLDRMIASGQDSSRLFFVTGADAFAEIASWNDYPALLDLCHFVVVSRPGHPIQRLGENLPALVGRMTIVAPRAPVVEAPGEPRIYLVDADTRDVSSTDIRARAARGDSLEGLVPAEVATYIRRQGLYGSSEAAVDLHG